MKKQAQVKQGFEKAHLSGLVLLNLERLAAKKIQYQQWKVNADYQLNVDADVEGLWVCRYNRLETICNLFSYVIAGQYMYFLIIAIACFIFTF